MKTKTQRNWKLRILLAALPLAAVTVGCVAAQDDPDALLEEDAQHRAWAGGNYVRLKIVSTQGMTMLPADFSQEAAEVAQAAREAAKGGMDLDDLILPALYEEPIGVRLAVFEDGTSDACTVDVATGSNMLGELAVQLQITTTTDFGGVSVLNRVENEDACDGDGYFFDKTESGEFGQISMCPSSCDAVLTAEEKGVPVMVDVVIDQG